MSDLDQALRDIADLKARVRALEKDIGRAFWKRLENEQPRNIAVKANRVGVTWCNCAQDVCRAPDCPSHKPDPMGR